MLQRSILTPLLTAAIRKMARLQLRLRRAFAAASYRPELHYMRGPGPKCGEKQAAGAD